MCFGMWDIRSGWLRTIPVNADIGTRAIMYYGHRSLLCSWSDCPFTLFRGIANSNQYYYFPIAVSTASGSRAYC